ncbi:MAG: hypothetical protein V4819_21640 [Verrucomicrobiota bacterium]
MKYSTPLDMPSLSKSWLGVWPPALLEAQLAYPARGTTSSLPLPLKWTSSGKVAPEAVVP